MRLIVVLAAAFAIAAPIAVAQSGSSTEVQTSCEAHVRANPLPQEWTLEQALGGCTCLAERSEGDAALQQELISIAALSAAEAEARQSARAAEMIAACWAAPTGG